MNFTYAPSGSTIVQEKHEGKIKPEFAKEWVVIVWNDPVNLMSYVTFVFQKLFGYSKEEATRLMLDVHTKEKQLFRVEPKKSPNLTFSNYMSTGFGRQ